MTGLHRDGTTSRAASDSISLAVLGKDDEDRPACSALLHLSRRLSPLQPRRGLLASRCAPRRRDVTCPARPPKAYSCCELAVVSLCAAATLISSPNRHC